MGVLTTQERDMWARERTEMEGNPRTREALRIVDSALFMVALDDHVGMSWLAFVALSE